jgi:flagellar biogenesis protein FliO
VEEIQQATIAIGVLVALGITLYILRSKGMVRFNAKGPSDAKMRRLQSIERLPLTAQHSLHLVRVAGRLVLIAVSPGGCSVLDGGVWDGTHAEGRLAE